MSKIALPVALALSAVLAAAPSAQSKSLKPAAKMQAAKSQKAQNVTVTVDGSGYHPSTINVKAGRPVHMTFVSKGTGCSNGVVIPGLNKKLHLKMGQQQTISWTPKKAQSIAFSCEMNMFHGKIVAK